MANRSITQLQVANYPLTGMEVMPIVQGGVTKQALLVDMAAFATPVITNDTASTTPQYPIFAEATSGNLAAAYISSPNYLFTPSTGELAAPTFNATNGIFVNSAIVSQNQTIATGDNAMSAGPITVASTVTVTVVDGSWTVVGSSTGAGLPQPYGVAGDVLVSTGAATTPAWEVLNGGSF